MAPHQQRVIEEKATLDEKLTKLKSFIVSSETFAALPEAERLRMNRQHDAMEAYSNVLGERIAAF